VQDIWRAITFQLKKLLLLVVFGLPLLLFNFLPPIGGLIASLGWITLASILVFLDFIDPPLERRRLSFRTKLGVAGSTFPASATFGVTSLWLVSIPFLNLITVPLCIIAGTLFCCDYALPQIEEDPTE
jgi:CysZ protein